MKLGDILLQIIEGFQKEVHFLRGELWQGGPVMRVGGSLLMDEGKRGRSPLHHFPVSSCPLRLYRIYSVSDRPVGQKQTA